MAEELTLSKQLLTFRQIKIKKIGEVNIASVHLFQIGIWCTKESKTKQVRINDNIYEGFRLFYLLISQVCHGLPRCLVLLFA